MESKFYISPDGAVSIGSDGSGRMLPNVAVWAPSNPAALSTARDARLFTCIGTRHSQDELRGALDSEPGLDKTSCLLVDSVVLVASSTMEEHAAHVDKILELLVAREGLKMEGVRKAPECGYQGLTLKSLLMFALSAIRLGW